jgi:hypothetical protein
VEFSVGRLKWRDGWECFKMGSDSSMNDSLENLGYEIEIGYGSIASQILTGKRVFFEKRFDNCIFKGGGKGTFSEGEVNKRGDRENKGIEA